MQSSDNNNDIKQPFEAVLGSIASYDVGALMAQTRKLASDYRIQTGHALPVTEELARFDAINILGLKKLGSEEGIDATDKTFAKPAELTDSFQPESSDKNFYNIKGRVIFKGGKARQKLGKLSIAANWTVLLMVIYDSDYMPVQIFSVNRHIIDTELNKLSQDKRGSMTIAKYKAIGDLVWDNSPQN